MIDMTEIPVIGEGEGLQGVDPEAREGTEAGAEIVIAGDGGEVEVRDEEVGVEKEEEGQKDLRHRQLSKGNIYHSKVVLSIHPFLLLFVCLHQNNVSHIV